MPEPNVASDATDTVAGLLILVAALALYLGICYVGEQLGELLYCVYGP
jgi:hypothetical protein